MLHSNFYVELYLLKVQIVIFWVLMPCSIVNHCQPWRWFLQNIGSNLQHFTVPEPRKSQSWSSLPWKPQISYRSWPVLTGSYHWYSFSTCITFLVFAKFISYRISPLVFFHLYHCSCSCDIVYCWTEYDVGKVCSPYWG